MRSMPKIFIEMNHKLKIDIEMYYKLKIDIEMNYGKYNQGISV